MNESGSIFEIVRALTRARKYVMPSQEETHRARVKQHERQIEIARGPNFKASRNLQQKSL